MQNIAVFGATGAIGLLHHAGHIVPEKSLRDINAQQLHQYFHTNTVLPMLIAKYALPKLTTSSKK